MWREIYNLKDTLDTKVYLKKKLAEYPCTLKYTRNRCINDKKKIFE